jgi:hypothetical protein
MRSFIWRRIPFSVVILILGIFASDAQDRTSNKIANPALSAAARLPANYRLLMANYLRTHNPYPIKDAMITPPYEKFGGLFRGGTFPAVCVAIFRNNPFGIVVRDNWVLTIENGQVKKSSLGLEQCAPLSPFNELKSR